MKLRYLLILLALVPGAGAIAVDSSDVSPYDKNPACVDTTTDASTGKCVVQTEGTPRHKYPPPGPAAGGNTTGTASTTSSTPASPIVRKSVTNSGGK